MQSCFNYKNLFLFLIFSLFLLQLHAGYKPTTYKKIRQIKNLPNSTLIGYSFNHRLIVFVSEKGQKFYVANGYTYQLIDSFTPDEQDSITCFSFAEDSSFLILGTNSGFVYLYAIKNYVFDPVPGKVAQNKDGKRINSIDVCSQAHIAVGGNSQDLSLYFLSGKTINFLNKIPFGQVIKTVKFSPNCRKVLVGGTSPSGKFIAYDYYDKTININNYSTYSSYHATYHIAQASNTNIHILDYNFYVIQQSLQVPMPPNYVMISFNQFYLISGDGNSVKVWDISNISGPTIFFSLNKTYIMSASFSGSDILVLTNIQDITYELYSPCKAGEFYDSSYYFPSKNLSQSLKNEIRIPSDYRNQCGVCDETCTICNSYNQCFACVQSAYLNQTTCKVCRQTFKGCLQCNINDCLSCDSTTNFAPVPIGGRCLCKDGYYSNQSRCMKCGDSIIGCLICKDQKTCSVCDDYGHFIVDPSTNRCICAPGYYVNAVQSCVACSHKIQFCTLCSKDGATCNKCQDQIHRIVNPSNKSKCICDDFYYETSQKKCQQCDFIQKCKRCINQNVCQVCNEQNHWIVNKNNTCSCMSGYFQKNDELCIYCNILGCDKCQAVNSCYLCNQQAGFNPSPQTIPILQCKCKNHTFLNNQKCSLCQQYISYCDLCNSKTKCVSCKSSFILSLDNSSCTCPQNFSIKDQKCIENESNLLQIILIIMSGLIIAGVSVVIYIKYCKKRKNLQQNFQTEDNKLREQSQGSKSLLSSLNERPQFKKSISESQNYKK